MTPNDNDLDAGKGNEIPSSAETKRESRAREKEAAALIENAGLPSVNRKRNSSKLINALGFVAILGVGTAMIVSVNGGENPTPQKKKSSPEKISNNLPELITPSPPKELVASAAVYGSEERGMPIAPPSVTLASPAAGLPAKPGVPDWMQRKLDGSLLVGGEGAGGVVHMQGSRAGDRSENEGGGRNSELAAKLEPTIMRGVSAGLLPDRNFLITKGTSLDCALETALDSTVPGLTTCHLTRDVYSDNGQVLLLDRRTQLVGEYQGGIRHGEARLFVLWTRAKTPNGVIVALNSPGTDALGRAGLEGWVDTHFAERFGAAIMLSLIKDSVALLIARQQSNGGGGTTVYGNTTDQGQNAATKALETTINIPPTLIKNQGDHIQIMVARDLDFSKVYGLKVN